MSTKSPSTPTNFTAFLLFVLLLTGTNVRGNEKVFQKLVLSTAFIWHVEEKGEDEIAISSGTGWIIDYRNGYLITNEHVVHGKKEVRISFPQFRDGKVIRSAEHYLRKAPVRKGTVVATDKLRDLAVVKVDAVPSYMRALNISGGDPIGAGEDIYTIGNKIDIDQVFIPRTGKVQFRGFGVENIEGEKLIGDLLYTSSAFVQGNSGGPIVNKSGALVGVVAAINRTETQNINIGSVELESWLGLTFGYRNLNFADPLDGYWVVKIRQTLKRKDDQGRTERDLELGMHSDYSSFDKRLVDGEYYRGYFQLIGRGHKIDYSFRLLTDKETKHTPGFPTYTPELQKIKAITGRKFAIYPKKVWEDDGERKASETDGKKEKKSNAKGQESDRSSRSDSDPLVFPDFRNGIDWLDPKSIPKSADPFNFDDVFNPNKAKPDVKPKLSAKRIRFGTDTTPPISFGVFREAQRAILDKTSKDFRPGLSFQLTSNDPHSDWSKATWLLTPYEFKGDVAKKLKMTVGDDREHPRPDQLPNAR